MLAIAIAKDKADKNEDKKDNVTYHILELTAGTSITLSSRTANTLGEAP
jgi:hypothetical protein